MKVEKQKVESRVENKKAKKSVAEDVKNYRWKNSFINSLNLDE